MLTTKVITPRQGESYYAKENYYSAEESVENSQWMGKGAKQLGLKGKVKPKHFKKLLYGELPNGTRFRTKKKERAGYKERAGLDCTFSAPKSVSILALVEGRKELETAHKKAVLQTLKIIERDYATTRVSKDGRVKVVKTGNLVCSQFHHDTSRELDPHLHTHCVILNMTNYNDRWYSFRNDDIHANKKLLGMIYQNELAIQVKKLGYEIEQKGHGQFEIKGFTEEQLQSFSKRREQIKSQLKEESTWFDREKAWDKTRIAKGEPIPRDELQDYWRKELRDVSYPQPSKQKPEEPKLDVTEAVNEAIEHCSERTVAFKPEEIQKFIFSEVGKYQQQKVEQAISDSQELIHLDKQVTTQTALLREIATIRLVKQGQDKVEAISTPEAVAESIAGQSLTEGQKNAITLAATSSDQFIAWQGKAGVGKTYALNEFKNIAKQEGYVVKGFAPSAKAAKVLSQEMEIETTTVARKLVSQSMSQENQQQEIWIVDEAGLLGAKDAYYLLQKAEAENARVLLVGDTRQLSSVAAGNPFKSLQQAGIATAHLNQSLRQKTKDLKHAVDLISDGKIAEGINILDANQRIEEIQDGEQRANRIALDYLKLSPTDRQQTLIIAGTHQEREAILDRIREGLKQEGTLGEEFTTFRLKSKNLTNIQQKYSHYYEVGNVVIPLANYKRLGLEKNQQYQVKAVEEDTLVLVDLSGAEKRVSPASFKYKEIYEAKKTKIAVGDRLRWGKNDKQLNRINGEEFVVTQIAEGIATICAETGKREQIDLKTPQHLDHALVSTTYSSQGVTANRVYISATNDFTLSQESFYVAASRAKYNLQFYVENRAKLVENAQTSRAQLNPLELIQQHQQQQVAFETELSSPAPEKQNPNTNTTSQPNHERNQADPTDFQRDSDRSSQPSKQPTRQFRVEPPILKTRARGLSDGINGFTEQQAIERLKGNFRELNRHIKNGQLSNGRTKAFRDSVDSLNRTIAEYARQQERQRRERKRRERERRLKAVPRLHYNQIRKQIMQNLNKLNPADQEILKLKTEKLTEQIKQLEAKPQVNKRKQRERDSLEKQLANICAYTQLTTGQQVTLNEQTGTITYLKLSPGGLPEAWVKWDNYSVPIPEQPSRLEVIDIEPYQNSQLEHESTRSLDSQQPESVNGTNNGPNIGRRSSLRLETSSREVRPNRRQIDRPRVQPDPQATTGRVEPKSSTNNQSVKSDRRKARPTLRKTGATLPTARPGIERDVIRVDLSRRSLNRSNQQFGQAQARFREANQQYERIKQQRRELANKARNMPLSEVAERLGLEPDRYDPHKYKGDGLIISINDQKFYDHTAMKGGGGACDLVMHVQQSNFKEAVEWLNGHAVTPINRVNSFSQQPTQTVTKPENTKQPFQPPAPDDSKWAAVKDYLITTRGLPESLVDNLYELGSVYADSKQNAVFLRKNLEGEITGASLRGTYEDSTFKRLAKGTNRDAGWFALKKGEGEPERIVLTESPIDALSAAAISQKQETTLFISTDGSGSIPHQFLQQQLQESKQVLVAYDNDEAGQTMAQRVLEELPGAQRITPKVGKDWNEELIQSQRTLEQEKQLLRQEYERLRTQVHSNPNHRNAGVEKVDIAIAMLVLKESAQHYQQDNLLNRVGKVLSQSDRLREWKQSMPENEYKAIAQEYIIRTFEKANQIRENILSARKNQEIEFER